MEVVTINLIFEDAISVLMINRNLFLQYYALCVREEERIRFLMNLEKAEDLILKVEKNKYRAHELIFDSVRLGHPVDDFTVQEYFLQQAVKKYVSEKKHKAKEPEIMTVTITTPKRGGYSTKVKINNYRKKTVQTSCKEGVGK